MLVVLLGGARAGKSRQAERLARRTESPVTFIATCPHLPDDLDLEARIANHRANRPADWTTIEETRDLTGAIRDAADDVVIVDCLTTWVGSLAHEGVPDTEILWASEAAIAQVRARSAHTIVVSNEVGAGIIPADAATRSYRDVLGHVNQQWVSAADRAVLMVAGRSLELRPMIDPW